MRRRRGRGETVTVTAESMAQHLASARGQLGEWLRREDRDEDEVWRPDKKTTVHMACAAVSRLVATAGEERVRELAGQAGMARAADERFSSLVSTAEEYWAELGDADRYPAGLRRRSLTPTRGTSGARTAMEAILQFGLDLVRDAESVEPLALFTAGMKDQRMQDVGQYWDWEVSPTGTAEDQNYDIFLVLGCAESVAERP